ncbi:MAG: hypothetical protein WD399_08920 [Thermoleophilaceae bacterium]
MVATGRRLLEHEICHSAVLFAGDMSWAQDYHVPIMSAVQRGKAVTVVYPEEKHSAAKENARVLEAAGATLVPTRQDTRLRAMLLDHERADEAMLYVVNKERDGQAVRLGSRPGDDPAYAGKIYRWKEDALLISTATKLYEFVAADVVT